MSRELQALLEAFDHLPAEEKRAFAEEVLRRALPFDSGTLSDEEIGSASAALGESLDQPPARKRTPAEAVARMRASRKDVSLGGLKIKDLIDEGRK